MTRRISNKAINKEISYRNQKRSLGYSIKMRKYNNTLSNRKNYWKKKYKKARIRSLTQKRYGKLGDNRLERHHYKPYNRNEFIVLEKGVHKWMHKHPKSFKLGGLNPKSKYY